MARLRQSLTTTLGAHSLPSRITLHARRMGLDVTIETAGGWWEREHLIVASGTDEQVRRFQREIAELGS